MTRNIVTKSTVPFPPYASDLFCLPIASVPFVLGALYVKSQKYWYASTDDATRGAKLLAEVGRNLLMPCGNDIINAIDRLTVLFDATINGVGRSTEGIGTDDDPFIYTPPLSQEGVPTNFTTGSIHDNSNVLRALLANIVTGALSSAAPGEAIPNQKLQAILEAIQAMGAEDGPTFEQVAQLIAILGA